MNAKLKVKLCLLLSLLLSSCVSTPPEPAETFFPVVTAEGTSTIVPTSTYLDSKQISETASPDYYPLSTRTGIADVDLALDAVESGNSQQLRELIRFTSVACTNADGLGGPPKCQDEEAEGTIVEVLPFLGSEGSFLRKTDLSNFPGFAVVGLYAVYKSSATAYSEVAYPAGEYAIVLAGETNMPDIVIQIREGIIRIDYLYSQTSWRAVLQRDAGQMILTPKQ